MHVKYFARFAALYAGAVACVGFSTVESSAANDPRGRAALAGIYHGWLASELLDNTVRSKNDEKLGVLRNLILDRTGEIEALLIEHDATPQRAEFVFQVPWSAVAANRLPAEIVVNVANALERQYRVFPDKRRPDTERFRVTDVIGDFARLQTGLAFGYVSDVVFGRDGSTMAVLVSRDSISGGGTFAFPFSGIGKWNPNLSYYGLRHVTPEQAKAAALRVDLKKFGNGSARSSRSIR